MITARPRRRFGQHFLRDRNIIGRIIAVLAPGPDDRFVEIGPGEGAITAPLLERVRHLDVIEIDRDLAAALPGRLRLERPDTASDVEAEGDLTAGPADGLSVHRADALRFDFRTLAGAGKLRLVGNLPYNISTPLLFHLLDQSACFADLHVMLQKEVGDRMTASPGSKTYGRLTVALAVRCRIQRLFPISPGSFRPPPKVDSVFLRLVPDTTLAADLASPRCFDLVLTRTFSMRRKTLANGLRELLPATEIRAAGLDPGGRAEQLAPGDFVRLANRLARLRPDLASAGPLSQNGCQP